ncbi:hypothetical protein EVG20_g6630 [Dentipellis fragilis]|uniref:BAH domain-containing protein n=1 Tax=Dentipellis fragilis TaxID=205917 RepID=A0A4Y9YJT6_9AGAM|nr:hypothetical protein EVG20_g6630 [Dentipellis fragilis]
MGRNGRPVRMQKIRVLGGSMSLTGDNELHTYWIARVAAIHAREPWNVWLQVQWYYSGPDIEKEDPEHTSYFGRYERALSDTWDIIHWESVDGHATVVNFDSSSLEQEPIDEGAFYYRWNWSRANKTLNGPSRSPSTSCIGTCEELYNPDGNSPMHLCPRPSCRRWFHRICLFTTNCTIRRSAAEHADLLLRSSPDSDEDFSLFKPSKPAAARMTASRRNKGKGKEICLPLDDLPSPLRRCAQKAIVRGGEYGVAGNVHAVVQARRLVYQIFKNEPDSQKDLDKWMEGREGDVDTEDSEQDEYGEYYICPNCKGAI